MLARQYGLSLLYLFGSAARGDMHAMSDTDIAYLGQRPLSLRERATLVRDLRVHIPSPERAVDLVDLATAPPLLGYHILKEGRKLYGHEMSDDAFYRRTMKCYIDAQPLFALTNDYVHAHKNL